MFDGKTWQEKHFYKIVYKFIVSLINTLNGISLMSWQNHFKDNWNWEESVWPQTFLKNSDRKSFAPVHERFYESTEANGVILVHTQKSMAKPRK